MSAGKWETRLGLVNPLEMMDTVVGGGKKDKTRGLGENMGSHGGLSGRK